MFIDEKALRFMADPRVAWCICPTCLMQYSWDIQPNAERRLMLTVSCGGCGASLSEPLLEHDHWPLAFDMMERLRTETAEDAS